MTAGGILVWSERPTVARELLGQARRIADSAAGEPGRPAGPGDRGEVGLCVGNEVCADEVSVHAEHGADVVYPTGRDERDPAGWAAALCAVIAAARPRLLLVGATKTGLEVGPRVAERCQAAYAAWAVEIGTGDSDGVATAGCVVYGGAGLARYRFSAGLTVLAVTPGAFEARELAGRTARAVPVRIAGETPRIAVLAERSKPTGGASLREARAIVDIGRGVADLDDLQLARSLADLLDGELSCSRPVASGRDWLPEWLGLSGAKVKPELCVAIGISGAIQHMVGIRESRVIVAVNKDESAAIFAQADIGAVADLREFLPELIERMRARGARPAWSHRDEEER